MIKLFDSTATEFSTLGLGILNDATKCVVTEERNGSFELEMQYPIDGILYDDIALRSLIVCKSNPFSSMQAFRVYYMSKPINGLVTIKAEHISYDLSGMVVSSFTANTAQTALEGLKSHSTPTCNFTFTSDKENTADFAVKTPSSLRSLLGGVEGSVLDIFGTGEYEFNNFNVSFKTHRGSDRGVVIRYGKNLTDLTQEENCTKVYTAVYPYWAGTKYENETSTDILVTLPEKTVAVDGTFNYTRVMPLDLGSKFSNEQPTVTQLRTAAQEYISQNGIGKPEVSLKIKFVQLEQAEEYEQLKLLESVYLCDEVTVKFEALGVDSKAKCIKTEYNAITDKYESLEFGDSRTNLANTIVNQSEAIANAPTATFMEQEAIRASKLITGGLGGYVILHSSSGQSQPDELLILDENSGGDYLKSTKIWRFNKEGFGFSSDGYNGTYRKIAATSDGVFIADQVKASGIQGGTVEASLTLISPTIQNAKTNPSFEVDSSGNISGTTIKGNASLSIDVSNGSSLRYGNAANWPRNLVITNASWGGGFDVCYGGGNGENSMDIHFNNIEMYDGDGNHKNAQFGSTEESDIRLKKDIKNVDFSKIRNIFKSFNFKTFRYIKDDKDTHYGLIAQDVIKVLDDNGINGKQYVSKDKDGYYSLMYPDLSRFNLMATQDLYNQIEELQNEINKLREEIK